MRSRPVLANSPSGRALIGSGLFLCVRQRSRDREKGGIARRAQSPGLGGRRLDQPGKGEQRALVGLQRRDGGLGNRQLFLEQCRVLLDSCGETALSESEQVTSRSRTLEVHDSD